MWISILHWEKQCKEPREINFFSKCFIPGSPTKSSPYHPLTLQQICLFLILCNSVHSQMFVDLNFSWYGNNPMELWHLLFTISSCQVTESQICFLLSNVGAWTIREETQPCTPPEVNACKKLIPFYSVSTDRSSSCLSCFLTVTGNVNFYPPPFVMMDQLAGHRLNGLKIKQFFKVTLKI